MKKKCNTSVFFGFSLNRTISDRRKNLFTPIVVKYGCHFTIVGYEVSYVLVTTSLFVWGVRNNTKIKITVVAVLQLYNWTEGVATNMEPVFRL